MLQTKEGKKEETPTPEPQTDSREAGTPGSRLKKETTSKVGRIK